MSLKKSIFKNGIASTAQKFLRVGEQLLLVPFFLSAWGVSYYGEWLTISALPTIIAFSNLGIGTAAANFFVLDFAANEYRAAKTKYWLGMLLVSGAILLAISLSIFGLLYLNKSTILENLVVPKKYAIKVIVILFLSRILNFYYPLIEARFLIQRRAVQAINIRTFLGAIKIIVTLILLIYGGNMIQIAIIDLITTISILLISLFFSWKALKSLKQIKINYGLKEFKPILTKGLYYLISPLWQGLFFQGTTLIVRLFLGTESVAIFNTIRSLTRSANQFFMIIENAIFPDLQFEFGKNNLKSVKIIFRWAFILSFLGGLCSVIILGLLGLPFYEIWTSGKLNPPKVVWWILISGIFFNGIWWSTYAIFRAANKPENLAKYGIVNSVITLVISFVLTKHFAMNGAAFSMLIMELLMLFFLLPAGCKIINQDLRTLFQEGIKDFLTYMKLKIIKKNVS